MHACMCVRVYVCISIYVPTVYVFYFHRHPLGVFTHSRLLLLLPTPVKEIILSFKARNPYDFWTIADERKGGSCLECEIFVYSFCTYI